jgi:UDP:flavonoid glycosyltransferase YjiC (YdhE family)
MKPNCLFIVNGLGMGNSTRCFAIMEHLHDRGASIHVLTSGNGLEFFQDKKQVTSLSPMASFYYAVSRGRISAWHTVASLRVLAQRAREKKAQLEKVLSAIRPDVAVIDSEYTVGPLRQRAIPVVGLNNSEIVVSEYLRATNNPSSVRSHFWCIEFGDYLFHRHFCDLVLSSAPLPTPTRHARFKRIGLIFRRSLLSQIPSATPRPFVRPREVRNILFMLSGSIHAPPVSFDTSSFPFHIDVVGQSGESKGDVVFHGRLMNNIELLMKADALVVNGGYSAFSEAVALGKPTVIIPIAGHAEQLVNARFVEQLGCGFIASDTTVMDRIEACYEANEWPGLKPRSENLQLDGATQAADAILALAERRS